MHYSRATPGILRRRPGTHLIQTSERMRTTPQTDPHPEAGSFGSQMIRNSGQETCCDMVTGVQRESLCGCDMVTGATEQIRSQRDMLTNSHEEVTYCSPSTSSGKQKKNRSTSQPQFRSENTPATIEADQILLALQQLANNNNSANFPNNINRISKLPKSLTTTMPTFDGKSEKFEFFEDLFQTSLKIHYFSAPPPSDIYFVAIFKMISRWHNVKCEISPLMIQLWIELRIWRQGAGLPDWSTNVRSKEGKSDPRLTKSWNQKKYNRLEKELLKQSWELVIVFLSY